MEMGPRLASRYSCDIGDAKPHHALVDRFSTSRFWADVVRFDCTLFQYIGELCRYLLNAPTSQFENEHHLRFACGSGPRGDIWKAFQERFAVPRILEFYAATESNFSFYNVEGKVGAIGKIPPMFAHRFPAALVKIVVDHGALLRDRSLHGVHAQRSRRSTRPYRDGRRRRWTVRGLYG
jgi:fatty-acyl-CoA synthase